MTAISVHASEDALDVLCSGDEMADAGTLHSPPARETESWDIFSAQGDASPRAIPAAQPLAAQQPEAQSDAPPPRAAPEVGRPEPAPAPEDQPVRAWRRRRHIHRPHILSQRRLRTAAVEDWSTNWQRRG